MLRKYSHFSDLQATDKYKTNSTIGCMLKLNRAFTPPPPLPFMAPSTMGEDGGLKISEKSLPGERRQSQIFIWVKGGILFEGGVILLGGGGVGSHNFGVKVKTA